MTEPNTFFEHTQFTISEEEADGFDFEGDEDAPPMGTAVPEDGEDEELNTEADSGDEYSPDSELTLELRTVQAYDLPRIRLQCHRYLKLTRGPTEDLLMKTMEDEDCELGPGMVRELTEAMILGIDPNYLYAMIKGDLSWKVLHDPELNEEANLLIENRVTQIACIYIIYLADEEGCGATPKELLEVLVQSRQ